jgi:hypothetical protein
VGEQMQGMGSVACHAGTNATLFTHLVQCTPGRAGTMIRAG